MLPSMIFADVTLARRLERAEAGAGASFVEAHARLSPESNAEWVDLAGTYAMFDGVDSPITQTFGLGLFAEASAAELDRIEAFFRERGAPVTHEVSPLAGLPTSDMLSRRGYRPIEFTSVLYQPLKRRVNESRPTPANIRTHLAGAAEQELCSQLFARGWAEFVESADSVLNLGRTIASSDGAYAFVAELDGNPIATGVLRREGGVALLAGACTVPEARNHGAQRALLEARLRFALDHDCDLAMMCTAPGSVSQRNAEREGFRIAYTRTKWQLATGVIDPRQVA